MFRFNRVILTTVEEDFRKIGLLPQLTEADDPTKPRDIPSPAPEAGEGLDDSEGNKEAHQAGAKQPKPKMGPPPDDAEKSGLDPEDDGGSVGAQKGDSGSYAKVQGGKEASLESKQYMKAAKQPMSGVKGKNKGEKPQQARGLKPVKKVVGMKESRYNKAAALIEEVNDLLTSVQLDEEIDELRRGFQLVAENAALLADRLTEVSDLYQVEEIVSEMEELSADAAEALDIIEMELQDMGSDADEAEAVRHSSDVSEEADLDEVEKKSDRDADKPYDIPSPAFKEESELVLNAMVSKLMEALESYDNILDEMGMMTTEADDGDDDDGHEIHVHTKAKKVHIHHAHDGSDDAADDAVGDDMDDDDDQDMKAAGDDDDDYDSDNDDDDDDDRDQDDDTDESDHESDHDMNSLASRMRALKARREAMRGGHSFR